MTPILIPNQQAPPTDNGIFTKVWFLFFNSLVGGITSLSDSITANTSAIAGLALQQKTQTQLSAFAATLNASDAGLLVEVTDFRHVLRWSGSAWQWGPGEDGRHDVVALPVDPDDTTGWQLCDGTATTYLNGDGTTGNFTTPNLTGSAAYLKLGTPVAGPNAATAPTFTGNAVTPTGTVSAIAGTATAAVNVLTSSVTQVAAQAHTHPAPTFTGNALTPTGTVSSTGEPRNYVLRPFFRR